MSATAPALPAAARHPAAADRRVVVVLALLFMAGVAHWVLFFGMARGGPAFGVADWPKEYRYYSALQQAVTELRIPYFVSRPILESRKLLGLPEMTWSPQVLLLRYLSIGSFVAVNTVLLYAAGFAGLLLIRSRYRLSLLPFALLFLLFDFNGHIVAHLAIGHSMWVGYFLLPFFFLCLLEWSAPGPGPRWPVLTALVLFAIFLQGSFHVFVWCVLLLLLLLAGQPRRGRPLVAALLWTAALTACRLVPGALALLGRRQQDFLSGYPSAGVLFDSLVRIHTLGYPRLGGRFGQLDWWEYDAFLGGAGLLWLAYFGLYRRWRDGKSRAGRELELPAAVMALLSLDDLYYPINAIGLPLLSSQRVSSRLLIVPLALLITLAAVRTQRCLDEATTGRRPWPWALGGVVAVTALSLALHAHAWSLPSIEAGWPPPPHARDLAIGIVPLEAGVQTPRDAWYVFGVRASAGISAAALLAAGAQLWRRRRGPGAS